MEVKKFSFFVLILLIVTTSANAQSFLNRLRDRAVNAVTNTIENKVENAAQEVTEEVLSGKKNKETKDDDEDEAKEVAEVEEAPTVATSTDFKRGGVIMFQDDFKDETVGEFPSKWDLIEGTAEVKTFDGQKAVEITDNGIITPLIKEQGAYLPEEFTIEYDFYYWNTKDDIGLNDIKLCLAVTDNRNESPLGKEDFTFLLKHTVCDDNEQGYEYNNGSSFKESQFEHQFKQGWHHVALSFNKRALKVYFDGKRVVNLPRIMQPKWFCFQVPFEYENLSFIRNVVLAKGAVALYDRNEQSMTAVEKAIAETGKFVTNNILFDTGKATLKGESIAEIQKVADYMKKNPTARFEVQGHTDNQGSDAINDPLSQQRAEAIVKALEGLGVDGFNLKAVGKGSHEPVADNGTEAGRAKNRRVEFVKK